MAEEFLSTNADAVAQTIRRVEEAIQNSHQFLEAARTLIGQSEADTWSSQGANLGAAWVPAEDPSSTGSLLDDTGTLRNSLAGANDYTITENTLTIRTDVPYAKYHQLGIGVPARPFIGISDATVRLIGELYARVLNETLNA